MAWSEPDGLLTKLLSGNIYSILIALLIALSFPALLHLFLYRASNEKKIVPSFLLLGTSGSGKTALFSILQKRGLDSESHDASPTRTSQSAEKARLSLAPDVRLGSERYRSTNDPTLRDKARQPTKYYLIDTPGHGKLRSEKALSYLAESSLVGLIYVVDSSAFGGDDPGPLKDTASYLHDVLLQLQRRKTGKGGSKAKGEITVLIAANKQDLFTALPANAVRERLEKAIETVRNSKQRGLADVGAKDGDEEEEEDNVLGGAGEQHFTFKMLLDEYGIQVQCSPGECAGGDAIRGINPWEKWIGDQL